MNKSTDAAAELARRKATAAASWRRVNAGRHKSPQTGHDLRRILKGGAR